MSEKTKRQPCCPGLAHYFLIAEANGQTSAGVCKYCGVEGVFRNSVQNDNLTTRSQWHWFQLNHP